MTIEAVRHADGKEGHPSQDRPADERRLPPRRGPLFWVTVVIGWASIVWGIRDVFIHHVDTRPTDLAKFFLAGAVYHDLLFAPVVLAIGVVVARIVPRRIKAPVQAALIICGCATLFAWPEVRDYARVNHNPSSLPRNYSANLLVVIAAVVVVTIAVAVVTVLRRRKGSHQDARL